MSKEKLDDIMNRLGEFKEVIPDEAMKWVGDASSEFEMLRRGIFVLQNLIDATKELENES